MTTDATRPLRPAKNAAARMQEVMRRQKPEDADSSEVGSATSSATSREDSRADALLESGVTGGAEAPPPPAPVTPAPEAGDSASADPVKVAMLGLLARPYPAPVKGDMVVTSVKIPRPVWDRLEFARALTGDDKQEIIAKALRLYYDHLLRTGGEG